MNYCSIRVNSWATPKLLIYGLFQKGRVLAQDGVRRVLTFMTRCER